MKMWLRPSYLFIVTTLVLFVGPLFFTNIETSQSYDANDWATISIALGAVILTLVGIVTSILTSRENVRRADFSENLSRILSRLELKIRLNPNRGLNSVYQNSQNKLSALNEKMAPMKYADGLLGIISFTLFFSSALFAIWGYPFNWTFGSFVGGISLLGGYLVYYVEECIKIDVLSIIPKKDGKISLLSLKINDIDYSFEEKEKEIVFKLDEKINRVRLKVKIEGKYRNGFLDAFVKYFDTQAKEDDLGLVIQQFSWNPDHNTYLSDFGYLNDLTLLPLEPNHNTGLLQTNKKPVELDFDIILRNKSKKKIANVSLDGVPKKLYNTCSVPDNLIIEFIDIRLYEDPTYKPKDKRRVIDQFSLKPIRNK